ncbi:hypothetical protein DBR17_09765 [Sphingomonas sp. HMWF008]|nr:hypothetical protein DBR17_09765 [Sphingomonas sp. HMWF008]
MAGYSLGFGGNIGGLFSASDFFTITIQRLISTYVMSAGLPAVILFLRHRSGKPYISDEIAAEQDDLRKKRLENTAALMRIMVSVGFIVAFILWCIILFAEIYSDSWIEYYMFLTAATLAIFPFWWKAAERFKFYGMPVEIAWCIMSFAVGVVGLGLNAGERDRRFSYAELSQHRMHCATHVVLTPIGTRFLSVTPDGVRHIINDECKVLFDFQKRPIFSEGTLYELVMRKWDGKDAQSLDKAK